MRNKKVSCHTNWTRDALLGNVNMNGRLVVVIESAVVVFAIVNSWFEVVTFVEVDVVVVFVVVVVVVVVVMVVVVVVVVVVEIVVVINSVYKVQK